MNAFVRNALSTGVIALGLAAGLAHADTVKLDVWYSLNGPNRDHFEKMVSDFNGQQTDVRVSLNHFSTQKRLIDAARKVADNDSRKPDLIQLYDSHAPEVIAQHKEMLPLHRLLAQHPIKDASWFLQKTTAFVRDGKGQILAFPLMGEVPVMYYNLDAYRSAGLNYNKPAETWAELQAHLLEIRNVGQYSQCPYASSNQVNVHLENLAPINGKLYLTPGNGLAGNFKSLDFNFGTLYMRHLSLMVSWKKVDLMSVSADDSAPDQAFADGRCGVLTSTSSALGLLKKSGVKFGVAPLPFYPQESKTRQAPFVGGGALWMLNGKPAAVNKAAATFLGYLATPVVAARWHQQTGFLPLTDAAYRAADVDFYDRVPGARSVVEQVAGNNGKDSRGFRAPHYPQARAILNQGYLDAIEDRFPPMEALLKAKEGAVRMIRTGK